MMSELSDQDLLSRIKQIQSKSHKGVLPTEEDIQIVLEYNRRKESKS